MTQIVSRLILDTTPDDTINYRNLFRMNESCVQKFRSFKVALSSTQAAVREEWKILDILDF